MKKFVLISFLFGMFVSLNAQNSLTVEVKGIDNPTGNLYIALYDSKAPFLSDQAIDGKIVEVNGTTLTIVFDDLKNEEYAIAIYQDENKNKKLDMGEYGIPLEKYGFSNNVDPAEIKRAPIFDECKFDINGNTTITIDLVSAIK